MAIHIADNFCLRIFLLFSIDAAERHVNDAILIKNDDQTYQYPDDGIDDMYINMNKPKRYFEQSKWEQRYTSKDRNDNYLQYLFDRSKPFTESNYVKR